MIIQLKDIDREFKGNYAIKDFNYKIDLSKNDVIGLVGPNGAGKTTLLKLISGLLKPSSGMLSIEGSKEPYSKWVKDNLSFVLSGDRNLYYRNTAYENLMYFGSVKGIRPKELKTRIQVYSQQLKTQDLLKREVGTLSMGERKKISILVGLCNDSELLILDEPSVGLDVQAVIDLQEVLKNLNKIKNVTLIISSHDIHFLSEIANIYIFINDGIKKREVNSDLGMESIVNTYLSLTGGNETEDNFNIMLV